MNTTVEAAATLRSRIARALLAGAIGTGLALAFASPALAAVGKPTVIALDGAKCVVIGTAHAKLDLPLAQIASEQTRLGVDVHRQGSGPRSTVSLCRRSDNDGVPEWTMSGSVQEPDGSTMQILVVHPAAENATQSLKEYLDPKYTSPETYSAVGLPAPELVPEPKPAESSIPPEDEHAATGKDTSSTISNPALPILLTLAGTAVLAGGVGAAAHLRKKRKGSTDEVA